MTKVTNPGFITVTEQNFNRSIIKSQEQDLMALINFSSSISVKELEIVISSIGFGVFKVPINYYCASKNIMINTALNDSFHTSTLELAKNSVRVPKEMIIKLEIINIKTYVNFAFAVD